MTTPDGWLKTIKEEPFLLAFFAVIFLIAPGIMFLWRYTPQLLIDFDWAKLMLVSISITAPMVVINTFAIAVVDRGKRKKDSLFYDFLLATLMTGLVIYIDLGIIYLLNQTRWHLPVHFPNANEIVLGMASEIILVVNFWLEGRKNGPAVTKSAK